MISPSHGITLDAGSNVQITSACSDNVDVPPPVGNSKTTTVSASWSANPSYQNIGGGPQTNDVTIQTDHGNS